MKTKLYSKKLIYRNGVSQGDIIIAQPFQEPGYIKRTVILIIESDYMGSTGIILNKLSTIRLHEALPNTTLTNPVFFGGPDDIKLISFVHRNKNLKDCIPIADDLYWGGDFNELTSQIENKTMNADDVRFLAGFVEWHAGELELEVMNGKWWISKIKLDELLNTPHDRLWGKKLVDENNLYGFLEQVDDPCLN